MIVKRLFIQNYKCFGEDPTVINFHKSGISAFVGANNSGKSAALKALEILMGDKWPVSQFSEDDFHNGDHSKEIIIACEFKEPFVVTTKYGKSTIKGLLVNVRYVESGYGQSATDVDFNLIETINDFSVADWMIACYGGRVAGTPIYVSQEIRNVLPIAITIPLIKLSSEQPTNKWGVLGRMLQKVENVFSSDEEKRGHFETQIKEAVKVLREPKQFIELESNIKQFWEDIRPKNLSRTSLEFLDYDPWHYYRQFRLAITKNDQNVPLDSLGEGVQRLAIIALYRSYLKSHSRNQKAILLIEEPESYLHPQARSIVYNTLRKAVEGTDVEGQIIYTTHSSDFLDCGSFEEMTTFFETPEGSSVRWVNTANLQKQTAALTGITVEKQVPPNIYYRLVEADTIGLKDALFSDRAVVVEGSSEVELLKNFTEVDTEQISVVVAHGKNNIRAIYCFLTAFGIPTLICIDRDNKEGDGTKNQKIVDLVNHPNINNREKGWKNVLETDINSVTEGSVKTFSNLFVFSKNLENYLELAVPGFEELKSKIKAIVGDSKPKSIFLLGLIFKDKFTTISISEKQKGKIKELSEELKSFLGQELKKPNLEE